MERCGEIASGVCHLALFDRARLNILESELFDRIIDMETFRFALGAIANIAEDSH